MVITFGLMTVLVGGFLFVMRLSQSGAYWLTYESSYSVVIHRRLPDGRIHNFPLNDFQDVQLWDWSPDGRWLLFSDLATSQLYRVHISGAPVQQLSESPGGAINAAWSPDGQWITFAKVDQGRWFLHRIHAGGGEAQSLSDGVFLAQIPVWSPDGEWIAFAAPNSELRPSIYRVRPDGEGFQQLYASTQQYDLNGPLVPVWSPDGAWIVFSDGQTGSDTQIYRMRADGSDLHNLTDEPFEHFPTVFAEGGLYFSSNPGGTYNIFRIDPDAPGQPEAVTSGLDNSYVISASPNGTSLLTVSREYTGSRGPLGELQLFSADGSQRQHIRALVTAQPRSTIWSPLIDMPFRAGVVVAVGGLMIVLGLARGLAASK
jgi:Tol biopolymer transport system component